MTWFTSGKKTKPTDSDKKHRRIRRGAEYRLQRSLLELLEERRLLSSANLPLDPAIQLQQIGTDLQTTLNSAESDLSPILDHPLPIVGSQLGSAVTTLNNLANEFNTALSNGQNDISYVENALASALGPSGLGILPLVNGQFPSADEVSTNNGMDITRVEFKLPLTQTSQLVNSTLDFNAGLPGLSLSTNGTIDISVGYTFNLDFGYDSTLGFFLDTTPGSGTSLSLTATMTLPGGTVTGKLGFLDLTATDHVQGDGYDPGTNASGMPNDQWGSTKFTASFNIALADTDASQNNILPLSDIGSDLSLTAALTGDAQINLDCTVDINDAPELPSLRTLFHMDWPFADQIVGNNTSISNFGGEPTVGFEGVSLDLGSFFDRFVAPVVNDLQPIFARIQPIINFFNQNVPILDDSHAASLDSLLGLGSPSQVTILDVVKKLDPGNSIVQFISDADEVDSLIKDFGTGNVPGGQFFGLDLGSFNLGGSSNLDGADLRSLSSLTGVNLAGLIPDGTSVTDIVNEAANLASTVATDAGDLFDDLSSGFEEALGGGGDDLDDSDDGSDDGFGDNGGLDFPIIDDPESAFGLLLGQDVNLMTFKMPTLTISVPLPLLGLNLGPVGIGIEGDLPNSPGGDTAIMAVANISGGYDTHGIVEWAVNDMFNAGKAVQDLADGFYLNDDPADTSLNVQFGVAATGDLDLGIASGNAKGGIMGSFTFTLAQVPPQDSGKLRLTDIEHDIGAGDLFNVTGEIDASLTVSWSVFGFGDTYTIAKVVLWSTADETTAVPPIQTFTSLTCSEQAPKEGDYVSYTAVVQGNGASVNSGLVDFVATGPNAENQTVSLNNNGTATVSFKLTGVGYEVVNAYYLGNSGYAPSQDGSVNYIAGTMYVNAAETTDPDPDGQSWSTAFPTLWQGLAAERQNPSESGDTLDVAAGVYQPETVGGFLNQVFVLSSGVTIQGGFNPSVSATVPAPNLYVTVLEGYDNGQPVISGSGSDSTGKVAGCTIIGGSSSSGGGLTDQGGSPLFEDDIFYNNLGIDGGAVQNTDGSSPTFVNCLFEDNTAFSGAAIYNSDSSPKFINCTFAGNDAGTGGAVYDVNNSDPTFTNCILWNDTGGEVHDAGGSAAQFSYSDIDQGGYAGSNNNIDQDPNFEEEAGGFLVGPAYAPQFPSPCINTGNDTAIETLGVTTDLADNNRIEPSGGTVDMGCYEYQGPNYTMYVDQNAHGTNNGSSWANAFTSLQTALSYAGAGDTIDVAQGTYTPGSLASSTFQLVNGVTIQGGFATGGTAGPDPSIYTTYLNGYEIVDSSAHVVTGTGTNSTAILDGFTIENGNGYNDPNGQSGGGININGGSPQILNCTFLDNSARSGGAVYIGYGSHPLIANCLFVGNSAQTGGAVYTATVDSTNPDFPIFLNCAFRNNSAITAGGALYLNESAYSIFGCTFTDNSATEGGAIAAEYYSQPSVTNCILWNDTASASSAYNEIYDDGTSSSTITYSDVAGGFTGTGNVNGNPLFVSSTNLELQNGSPAIGSGNSELNAEIEGSTGIDTDLAGNPRAIFVAHARAQSFPPVDMGALAYQGQINLIQVGGTGPASTITAGSTFGLDIDLFQNNAFTVGDNSTVTLSIESEPSGASATLNGTTQKMVLGGFQAQFSGISVNGPDGTYSLIATDGGDIPVTIGPFTIVAPSGGGGGGGSPPTPNLQFIQQPTNVAVNAPLTPAVEVGVYSGDTLDTADDSSVGLELNGIGLISAPVVNGVADFPSFAFGSPGTFSLVAFDGGYTQAPSQQFTVTAAPAPISLVFNPQTLSTTAGATITGPITVTEIQSGSTYDDSTSTVTLSLASATGSGTLSGTLTAPVVDGVATFNNFSISATGAYVVQASDGNDIPGTLSANVTAPITYLKFITQPSGGILSDPLYTFQVAIEQNGQPVQGDDSYVVLSPVVPNSFAIGSAQAQALNGIATFSDTYLGQLDEYYDIVLQASDINNPSDIPTDSQPFSVTPGSPYYFTPNSSTGIAGDSISPGINFTLADAGNDPLPLDSSSVTASILNGPAGGVLTGATTEPMNLGFDNLVLDVAGVYTLQFTDAADGLTGYAEVTIAPQPVATQIVFLQQPSATSVGYPIDPGVAVALEDQYGNIETGDDTDAVTLSVASPVDQTLLGQVEQTVQGGIATFNDVDLGSPGTYTLEAATGTLTSSPTNSFAVTQPQTFYVDQNASGEDNGQDWADAFTNLQSALAMATIPGDTIDIAQGDYSPGNNPTDTFDLATGVTIQGGFETGGISGPDPSLYPTILDGTNTNYDVVTASGTNQTAVLEDVTITGGNGTNDSGNGAGLLAEGGSFTLNNVIFTNNTAIDGAAAYVSNTSTSPTFNDCLFEDNIASDSGGALYISNDGAAPVNVIDCTFQNNSATNDGGAIYFNSASSQLVNDLLVNNSANSGGAVYDYASSPSFTNCTIADNTASDAAVFNAGIGGSYPSFTNSILWNDNGRGEIEDFAGESTVSYSDIDGGYSGTGNIDQDPTFASNFALQIGSPALGAGDANASGLDNISTDIQGNPRFINGMVDMGAFEGAVSPILYVDANATGSDNGLSWANAFNSLQAALAVVQPGYTIEIAQGDYSPGSNANDTFALINGITLEGGFATGGLAGPAPAIYTTILDGGGINYHVVTSDIYGSTATLEDLTIENGNADGPSYSISGRGGGLYVSDCIVNVNDCTFTNNYAVFGGAIYYNSGGTITNSIFDGNTAVLYGGAIEIDSNNATVTNCLFFNNTADVGGAVELTLSDTTFTNCTFTQNSSSSGTTYFGTALATEGYSVANLFNCIIWGDTVYSDGSNGSEYLGEAVNSDIASGSLSGQFFDQSTIDADPLFVDPSDNDFQLSPDSPCINVGDNSAPGLSGITTDLAGDPRIIDGTVDIGAYEAQTVDVSWTGGGDGLNWTDPSNWSDDQVPSSHDVVTIPAGVANIQVGSDPEVGSFSSSSPIEITGGNTLVLYGASQMNGATLTVDNGATLLIDFGVGDVYGNVIDNGSVVIDRFDPSATFDGNISGNGSVTLDGFTSVTFTGTNTYTGGTTITLGTLVANSPQSLPVGGAIVDNSALAIDGGTSNDPIVVGNISGDGSLTIDDDADLRLATNSGNSSVDSLTINNGGTLDITNNQLLINYGSNPDPNTTILGYLSTGSNLGAWNGNGIISSTAAANSNYGVGYSDGADGIDPSLVSGQIELAYAQYGDISLQGLVNAGDFHILAGNFGQVVRNGWEDGDLTYQGVVNAEDFHLLAGNFGQTETGEDITQAQPVASSSAQTTDSQAIDTAATTVAPMATLPQTAVPNTSLEQAPVAPSKTTKIPPTNKKAIAPSNAVAAVTASATNGVNPDSKKSDPDAKFLAKR